MLRCLCVSTSLALVSIAGCGSPPPDVDGGSDTAVPHDAAPECHTAADCDDAIYCNGVEACTAAGLCVLGTPVRCDDSVACTVDSCSETLQRCQYRVPDMDNDGHGVATCLDAMGLPLGDDCADTDPTSFPGNPEVCDTLNHDEDCDPATHGGTDIDGDGIESSACCNGTMCGLDCNDGRRDVHPGAVEVCNGIDDNCVMGIDEGVTITVYRDVDGDGDGDINDTTGVQHCASTGGFSVYHTDCMDDVRTNSGRLTEVCDTLDNNCNGLIDDHTGDVSWYRDVDGDGFGSAASGTVTACVPPVGYSLLGTDCDDTTNTRSPARAEICDGIDDDCNGSADYAIHPGDLEDDDGDAIADSACGLPYGHDCDDNDPSNAPGTPETCDGRDNDCDTRIDEGVMSVAFFRDLDGDGYGSEASGTIVGCVPSPGYVRNGGDCDDANAARHPGGVEGCNATDDDCDGAIDEGSASAMCTLPNTHEACVAGVCSQIDCATNFGDCSLLTAGCESDLRTDLANCGHCGATCNGTCTDGVCSPIG